MACRKSQTIAAMFAVAFALGAGAGVSHAAGGHASGAGHTYAGGWHCAFGPGCRGYGYRGYGYPYGYGYGFGIGIGYGYGYGGYGYPYYGYGYPYGATYPVYVYPSGTAIPNGYLPSSPGPQPVPSGGTVGAPRAPAPESDVVLWVNAPTDAIVWINGEKTNQTGTRRQFTSGGLAPGRTYSYDIHAQWKGPDGRSVDLAQRVSLQAGERRVIDLMIPPPTPADIAPVTNSPGR